MSIAIPTSPEEVAIAGVVYQGGSGEEWIALGPLADSATGGEGDDILIGYAGADRLDGGDGFDILIGDNIDPQHRLARGYTEFFLDQRGDDRLAPGPDGISMPVYDGPNLSSGEDGDLLHGGAGTDILEGGEGNDHMLGGPGADLIVEGPGQDVIDGGDGLDLVLLYFETGTSYSVDLAAGTWEGGTIDQNQYISVEGVIGGYQAENDLRGDEGANALYGVYLDDVLVGRGGDDILCGNDGADIIDGGAGNDVLSGDMFIFAFDELTLFTGWRYSPDRGVDTLTGGAGADTFVLMIESGNDVITDFDPAMDTIAIAQDDQFADAEDVLAAASQSGDDVILNLSPDTQVTLQGVALEDLSANDFILFDQDTTWVSNEALAGF